MSADEYKYVNPADPQSLNLYGYVANNPVNSVDPTGHAAMHYMRTVDEGQNVGLNETTQAEAKNNDIVEATIADDQQHEQAVEAAAQAAGQQQQQRQAQANADRRAAIAAAAAADEGDTSMPYTSTYATCNLFVQRDIAKAGAPKPEVKKADGSTGAPSAAEWANSNVPGWRFLKPGETPQPGDVAAWPFHYSDATGHAGIVVSVDNTGHVTAMAAHAKVIGKDDSFNPSKDHPVITYRRYIGD